MRVCFHDLICRAYFGEEQLVHGFWREVTFWAFPSTCAVALIALPHYGVSVWYRHSVSCRLTSKCHVYVADNTA